MKTIEFIKDNVKYRMIIEESVCDTIVKVHQWLNSKENDFPIHKAEILPEIRCYLNDVKSVSYVIPFVTIQKDGCITFSNSYSISIDDFISYIKKYKKTYRRNDG